MILINPRLSTIFDFLGIVPEKSFLTLSITYEKGSYPKVSYTEEASSEETALMELSLYDMASLATVFAQRFFDVTEEDILLDGDLIQSMQLRFPEDVLEYKTEASSGTEFFGKLHSEILRSQLHFVAD